MSLASMLGPSPDWLVGVSDVNLCLTDCSWVNERSFDLYPFDAGVDGGVTYMVSGIFINNVNMDNQILGDFRHFIKNIVLSKNWFEHYLVALVRSSQGSTLIFSPRTVRRYLAIRSN